MPVNLKGRSFLTLKDFTPDEIRYMLNLAADLKAKKRAGIRGNLLAGKNIVLLFEKTSGAFSPITICPQLRHSHTLTSLLAKTSAISTLCSRAR